MRPRRVPADRLARRLGRARLVRLREIGARAARQSMRVYLVGGVVRDLLLGRAVRDLDLVVEGDALELARELERGGGALLETHAAFGTAALRLADGTRLDLATARRETYRHDAALPSVEAASLEQDLLRRDFTINSMALAVQGAALGELIDPAQGRDDLARRRIRVLHDRSFLDDPTRAFRAIRFAVRLGFSLDAATARLLRDAEDCGVFERLSAARLRREIELLFGERDWEAAARGLARHGLSGVVSPGLRPSRGEISRLRLLERWAARAAAPDETAPPEGWVVALAWLARRLDDGARKRMVERLAPPRRAAAELLGAASDAARIHAALGRLRGPKPSAVHGVCRSGSLTACLLALARTRAGRLRRALERYLERDARVRADIAGHDLLRRGIEPGPRVARGLAAALAAKLDGRARTRRAQLEAALAAARRA